MEQAVGMLPGVSPVALSPSHFVVAAGVLVVVPEQVRVVTPLATSTETEVRVNPGSGVVEQSDFKTAHEWLAQYRWQKR
jgi:hypothetical protein